MPYLARLFAVVATQLILALVPAQAAPSDAIPAGPQLDVSIRYEFAIYYPDKPSQPPLSVLRRQLQGGGVMPRLVDKLAERPAAAQLQAVWVSDADKSYSPPDLGSLQYSGRGLSAEQGRALQRAEQALRLDFAHPSRLGLVAYRRSLQLTEDLARETRGLIWDEETREVFTPEEWHKRRLLTWDGELPQVTLHTVIHAYQSDRLLRAITLGMSKFGLPDVVVQDFPRSGNATVGSLINALAQVLVEGYALPRAGEAELDLRAIRHRDARELQLKSLLDAAKAQARLHLAAGQWEAGDPRNRLIEIRFDRYEGPDTYARQQALLHALYGTQDAVKYVSHSDQLEAASRAAVAKLPQMRDRFRRGLKPGEVLLVKAPFATSQGGTEWMWVEVTAWSGEQITAVLQNTPFNVPSLRAGQSVKVRQSELFDYLYRDGNGREEGNTTGAIIAKMQEGRR